MKISKINMNKQKSKASTAFSLIELSIVILIVGIIVAGVTQSSRLVRQSKLKSAQSLTQSSPVNGIRSISVWFETTQDASFPSSLDDEGAITQWNDTNPQTQSRLYAVPAANATTPSSTSSSSIVYDVEGINGLPSIKFDGTVSTAGILAVSTVPATASPYITKSPVTTLSDPNAPNAFTAFMVYKLDSPAASTDYTVLYNGTSGTNGWGYYRDSGASNVRTAVVGATTPYKVAGTTLPTTQEIATITYSGYNSSNATGTKTTNLYINGGTNFTTTNATGSTTAITLPATEMYIGGITSATKTWKGYISEVIIFDVVLKTQDLKDVATYLSKKYNIPLS
jgi:prepilin-type N-terminal cleavage/methylation domain-containing protein